MDQPQPSPCPRLRALREIRRRLRSPRHDPHHAQTLDQVSSLFLNLNFLDRLLRITSARWLVKPIRPLRITPVLLGRFVKHALRAANPAVTSNSPQLSALPKVIFSRT